MSIYEDELADFEAARARMAQFFRVALHCHTPESHDWAKNKPCDKTANDPAQFLADGGEELFIGSISKNLDFDLLVPTDHMKCRYTALLDSTTAKQDGTIVIPGMEVSVRLSEALGKVKIHVLVLLPKGMTEESFSALLPGLKEERLRTGKEELEVENLRKWIEEIQKAGGICIAAHVDSDRGARYCFRQSSESVLLLVSETEQEQAEEQRKIDDALKELLFNIGFNAIEIQKPEHECHYHWITTDGEERRVLTVLGLDAHCLEDYQDANSLTLMKMTSPETKGLDGLKDALNFPEARIRFPIDLPKTPCPRIIGMSIAGPENQTFLPDLKVAFSENLNCIIGPRGAGKSALVEALRYVFGYNRTLEAELDDLAKRVRLLQCATLSGATIRVYYLTPQEELMVLEANFDPQEDYATRVYSSDWQEKPIPDVEKSGHFPLRYYGWSEIETLGREPWRQRAALDRMIPDKLDEVPVQLAELRAGLAESRTEIERVITQLQNILEENDGLILRYLELKEQFNRYNTADVKILFAKSDLLTSKLKVINNLLRSIDALSTKLSAEKDVNLRRGISEGVGTKEITSWIENELLQDIDVPKVEVSVSQGILKALGELADLKGDVGKKKESLDEELTEVRAELHEKIATDPEKENVSSLRENAKTRYQSAIEVRRRYRAKWTELLRSLVDRKRILKDMQSQQSSIADSRRMAFEDIEGRLNSFHDEKLRISIAMFEGEDREEFKREIPEFLLGIGMRRDAPWVPVLAKHFTPVQFSQMLLQPRSKVPRSGTSKIQVLAGLSAISGGKTVSLSETLVGNLEREADWVSKDDGAAVSVLVSEGAKLTAILNLQEVPYDDHIEIALNSKPVAECSPGQRSSAMLPLIALAETCPLVIDQPEDNLDNRLVGEVLVNILRELKETRQIIVCTHNPNIVVLGDAEQVIPLDAVDDSKGKIFPCPCGSVDNADIVETIINTMEGGREAFRARRLKYDI